MKVAMLTGGGDCPGLNAVIRAVVRRGESHGFELVGVRNGWRGLVDGHHLALTRDAVSGILPLGGTILGTSRTNPFKREGGVEAVFAADLVRDRRWGTMAALRGDEIVAVSLEEATKALHLVDPKLYEMAEVFFG